MVTDDYYYVDKTLSLAISKAGREYLDHMGKYPVIFLTFKNFKEKDWFGKDLL